jgi:hypothetical protein
MSSHEFWGPCFLKRKLFRLSLSAFTYHPSTADVFWVYVLFLSAYFNFILKNVTVIRIYETLFYWITAFLLCSTRSVFALIHLACNWCVCKHHCIISITSTETHLTLWYMYCKLNWSISHAHSYPCSIIYFISAIVGTYLMLVIYSVVAIWNTSIL